MNRLRQLVLMLSSDQDGEVVAAARAIGRHLKSDDKDWHWLADLMDQNVRRVPGQPIIWQDGIDIVIEEYGSHLSAKEIDFLISMRKWHGSPRPKQTAWLIKIFTRFDVKVKPI